MKKMIFGSLFMFALQGCVLVSTSQKPLNSKSSNNSKKCPPGHVWSDGKCHDTGKGHDKDKDKGKSGEEHGKDEDKGKGKPVVSGQDQ
jgi:hypothetical protein